MTWGLSPAQADEFLNEVIRNPKVQAKVEQEKYPEDQTETLDFYVDPKVYVWTLPSCDSGVF